MGMHVGFLTAECAWPALHAALEARCGALADGGEIPQRAWLNSPDGQDVLNVASLDGRTYLIDQTMIMSSNSDLVVDLAEELGCLVVGAGAETVSGTVWLTAAGAEGVRRLHLDIGTTLTQPYDLGDPLPSEASVPWDDIDGAGIIARLHDLGFSTQVLEFGPPGGGRRVAWEDTKLPDSGLLGALINDHCQRNERPDAHDWTKHISVHVRADGGFDLRGTRGWKPESRLRRMFKRRR